MNRLTRVLALALPLLAACADSPTGSVQPGLASVALHVVAPPSLARFGVNLAIEQVRVRVYRVVNDISEDVVVRTVRWNPSADQLNLSLPVITQQSSEVMFVDLSYETLSGQVLFLAGQTVTVQAGQAVTPPALQPFYIGPGSNVAFLALSPANPTVAAGDTLTFTINAIDSTQQPVTSVYVSWSSTAGSIDAFGTFRAPNSGGTVQVIAQTPNGTADTTDVTVIPANAGVISGRVIDASTGFPLSGVQVVVLDGQGNGVDTLTSALDGSYISGPLTPGVYTVSVGLGGYVATSLFDASLGTGGATTVPTIPLVPIGRGGSTTLGGTISDATSNAGIPSATVEIRAGVNATTGTPIATTTSDTSGFYFFSGIAVGTYTVTATANGFAPGLRTSVSLGVTQPLTDDISLAPSSGGVARWDPLESTCRHASLSIL